MKKISFLIAVLCCLTLVAPGIFAQTNLGLFGSAGVSTLNNHEGNTLKFGSYSFGVFGTLQLADALALEGQVSFGSRGDKYDFEMNTGTPPLGSMVSYDGKITMNYIHLAALVQVMLLESITVGGGLQTGILMSATDKGDGIVNGIAMSYDDDAKDNTESVDVAVQVEAILNLSSQIGVGLTAQKGLLDVWKMNPGDPVTNTYIAAVLKLKLTDN